MENTKRFIGEYLRFLRNERKLSQERLAEMAGVHPNYIGQLERGEKNATVDCLLRILDAMEVSSASFFSTLDQTRKLQTNHQLQIISHLNSMNTAKLNIIYQILELMEQYKKS